jgi:hypothetical protein
MIVSLRCTSQTSHLRRRNWTRAVAILPPPTQRRLYRSCHRISMVRGFDGGVVLAQATMTYLGTMGRTRSRGFSDETSAKSFPNHSAKLTTHTRKRGVFHLESVETQCQPVGMGCNSTPDLRNRFVVGIGSNYTVGATGGADSVVLTEAQMPAHAHSGVSGGATVSGCTCDCGCPRNMIASLSTGSSTQRGGNQPHENRPPYYALAYIMRVA